MHSTPETKGENSQSRIESLGRDSVYLTPPDCGDFRYIFDIWSSVGLCKNGSMSIIPMDWVDIASYSQFFELKDFEASLIVEMSMCYVSSVNNSKDPLTPAPYCHDKELAESQSRDRVAKQFKELKAIRKSRN